ncbi:MAG: elongation factor G [Deltaproteobacteria bacterium]|nr:elongation factor G [Deltaproteobacteria bacterium]
MTEKLRNIGLIAHGGAGKTTLADAILYAAGAVTRQGRVEEGNTTMDFEPEEVKRQTSINTGFFQFSWKKNTIYIMDTPGDQNFFNETRYALRGADSAIVVVDAVDGVKVQTEQAWEVAEELSMPLAIIINKLDRENADFGRAMADVNESLTSPKPIILQLPIGKEAGFNGVVDLMAMKAYVYDESGKVKEQAIPDDMTDAAETEREALIENVAEADDALLERYLEGDAPTDEELRMALRKGVLERKFVPVLCGCAVKNIGMDRLMDFVVDCMPGPEDRPAKVGTDPATGDEIVREPSESAPFSAMVIKTMADPYAGRLTILRVFSGKIAADGNFYNSSKQVKERFGSLLHIMGKAQKPVSEVGPGAVVAVAKLKETTTGDTLCDENAKIVFPPPAVPNTLISYAVVPKAKGDEEKIIGSLAKLIEEDPALKLDRNAETKEILLSGMGQVHIETAVEKMKRKFNVNVLLNLPKVPYRETIKKKVRVQGRHKKQTGGHGQYGDCWVVFEPLGRGEGFEFVDAIVGGVIPKNFIPAVEKGIIESKDRGVLAGCPAVDFRATVDFGSYHDVDSSEMAFKIAGSLAFKKAMEDAAPTLLEPVMKMTVIVPEAFTGDIMGDMNSRRGRVLGMGNKGRNQVIEANVPMAEVLSYAPTLNSMTGGRGAYTMEFSHYDEVPAALIPKIVEAYKREKEEEQK